MKRWLSASPTVAALITASLAATVLAPTSVHAVVDMRTSNFAETFLHADFSGTKFPLKVQAHTNSRSLFIGMYGYGWCSDFETKIDKLPEGTLRLTECGAGQETIYSTGKGEKSLEGVADQIMAGYKKTSPATSPEVLENMRQRLLDDSEYREQWAAKQGLSSPSVKKGVTYTADSLAVEQIVFDGTGYLRTLSDGSSQRFDSNGRLESIYDKNSNFLKISYQNDLIKEIVDNAGRKLGYSYYPNKRVKEITGPGGVKLEYKFKGEDLTEVKNMWGNTYTYAYDDNHNLSRINFPDGTFKAITYDAKRDLVTSFTDRVQKGEKTCVESYTYEVDKENPRDHYWATATKKCGDEVRNQARFEFWHRSRPDSKTKYLYRVVTKSMTDTLDVSYHPDFGRPVSIKKNGTSTTFSYYPSGLVREKSTNGAKLSFEYKNPFNKVSRVAAEYTDAKGKVLRKRETTFQYDAKSNLTFAANSDGQTVRLTYDARGRIASILDQAKKEVLIKYDDKLGKPASITRPKIGTINVTYKPSGEIAKVDSQDGPTVALQVTSTFNNLLDIISPATSELSL